MRMRTVHMCMLLFIALATICSADARLGKPTTAQNASLLQQSTQAQTQAQMQAKLQQKARVEAARIVQGFRDRFDDAATKFENAVFMQIMSQAKSQATAKAAPLNWELMLANSVEARYEEPSVQVVTEPELEQFIYDLVGSDLEKKKEGHKEKAKNAAQKDMDAQLKATDAGKKEKK